MNQGAEKIRKVNVISINKSFHEELKFFIAQEVNKILVLEDCSSICHINKIAEEIYLKIYSFYAPYFKSRGYTPKQIKEIFRTELEIIKKCCPLITENYLPDKSRKCSIIIQKLIIKNNNRK